MAQEDYSIANADGATVRADINNHLSAIVSLNSGATAPTTTFAYQLWADTSNNVLKQRDSTNTSWVIRATLDSDRVLSKTAAYTVTLADYDKVILADAASAAFTITMPAAATAGDGFRVTIIRINNVSSGNDVTIDGNASETINGSTTRILKAQYETARLVCDGSNWYTEHDHISEEAAVVGECQLVYVSATQIRLDRENGRFISIKDSSGNIVRREIPTSGVTLSNSGLTASTLYYIYAYWTGSAVALEASTTSPVEEGNSGIQTKNADATRTLVGMIRTNSSSQFVDAANQRFVRSWFNDIGVSLLGTSVSGGPTTTSTTPVEVGSGYRVEFLAWARDTVELEFQGTLSNSSAGAFTGAIVGLDSSSDAGLSVGANAPSTNYQSAFTSRHSKSTTTGYHQGIPYFSVSSGTGRLDRGKIIGRVGT